jgi:hypothetical protein
MSMPLYLVVGNLPNITLPTGHQVQATGNSDQDIETIAQDFDALIISAVGEATDNHGFLCRVGEYNERQTEAGGRTIPLLVHHNNEMVTLSVNGKPKPWYLRQSMYHFGDADAGDAYFVNTGTKGWENKIVNWLKSLPRRSRRRVRAA